MSNDSFSVVFSLALGAFTHKQSNCSCLDGGRAASMSKQKEKRLKLVYFKILTTMHYGRHQYKGNPIKGLFYIFFFLLLSLKLQHKPKQLPVLQMAKYNMS